MPPASVPDHFCLLGCPQAALTSSHGNLEQASASKTRLAGIVSVGGVSAIRKPGELSPPPEANVLKLWLRLSTTISLLSKLATKRLGTKSDGPGRG
jgi:hypothetical protein